MNRLSFPTIAVAAGALLLTAQAYAQQGPGPVPAPMSSFALVPGVPTAPTYAAAELDRLLQPIALYPDPLLAQVLAASTYPSDISFAARWSDEHRGLTGSRLSAAMTADEERMEPAVQALMPFPSVLDMMARDIAWTHELGNAVLVDRGAVMDAVQRLRFEASQYGYLHSDASVMVTSGPYIEILPADAAFIPVPYYDPFIVFGPPRPGVIVSSAISFGHGVRIGNAFAPWGWGSTSLLWPRHVVVINRTPWGRTWDNRLTYVHPYAVRRDAERRAESHDQSQRRSTHVHASHR